MQSATFLHSMPQPLEHSITVLIVTYNHIDHLNRAFESVVDQDLFSTVNVIISDDLSTDGTFELALSLAEGMPNVRVRRSAVQRGTMGHYKDAIGEIETDYVAVLEGDDFWTNPQRLLDQVVLFRTVPELNCVFSGYTLIDGDGVVLQGRPVLFEGRRNGFLYFEELLQSNVVASFSNCMFRTSAISELLSHNSMLEGYDWLVNLIIASKGPIGYIKGYHGSYRVHFGGAWSSMNATKKSAMITRTLELTRVLVSPRHHRVIDQRLKQLKNASGAI
jgi:glycosyltransferase involved in cell wall biosynthesis